MFAKSDVTMFGHKLFVKKISTIILFLIIIINEKKEL